MSRRKFVVVDTEVTVTDIRTGERVSHPSIEAKAIQIFGGVNKSAADTIDSLEVTNVPERHLRLVRDE